MADAVGEIELPVEETSWKSKLNLLVMRLVRENKRKIPVNAGDAAAHNKLVQYTRHAIEVLEPQLQAVTCAGGGSELLLHVASGNVALLDGGPETSDGKLPTGLEQSGAATSMAGTSRRNNSSANKKQQKRPRNPRDIKVTKWRCSVKIPALLGEKPVQPEPEDLFAKLREAEESIAEKAFKVLMQRCNDKDEFFSSDNGRLNPDCSGEEDSAAQKATAEENKSCPGGGGVGEVEAREEARASGTSSSDSDSTQDARAASSMKRGAGKQTSSAISLKAQQSREPVSTSECHQNQHYRRHPSKGNSEKGSDPKGRKVQRHSDFGVNFADWKRTDSDASLLEKRSRDDAHYRPVEIDSLLGSDCEDSDSDSSSTSDASFAWEKVHLRQVQFLQQGENNGSIKAGKGTGLAPKKDDSLAQETQVEAPRGGEIENKSKWPHSTNTLGTKGKFFSEGQGDAFSSHMKEVLDAQERFYSATTSQEKKLAANYLSHNTTSATEPGNHRIGSIPGQTAREKEKQLTTSRSDLLPSQPSPAKKWLSLLFRDGLFESGTTCGYDALQQASVKELRELDLEPAFVAHQIQQAEAELRARRRALREEERNLQLFHAQIEKVKRLLSTAEDSEAGEFDDH
ncbi:unnamed protein product [Amoebophrya sp. A120]|nr:unnamed protein product [Amoebophrya sp. A120]|eukprot:GSA120T00021306001.1